MNIPDAISELSGPNIIQILESLKHERVDEITEVDLGEDFDAQLIYLYLTSTGEIPNVPTKIYSGISNVDGQEIYLFVRGNGTYNHVYAADFRDILESMKSERLVSVLNGKKFANDLRVKKIDPTTLTELTLIPFNIKSAAIATGLPRVAFLNTVMIYHAKSINSESFDYTIKFNERGEYVIYKNINAPERGTESRSIGEVFNTTENVMIGGPAAIHLDPTEEKTEPYIQFGSPRES
ncbi:MAG: hypothetical protein ACMG57_01765 [Candidatus Dojkabacteria bacterium]